MRGTTPKARARELRKILKVTYDDGKGADFDNVVDCLTDLLHFCEVYTLDFDEAERIATGHHKVEWAANSIKGE